MLEDANARQIAMKRQQAKIFYSSRISHALPSNQM